jgi:hypothetical protein
VGFGFLTHLCICSCCPWSRQVIGRLCYLCHYRRIWYYLMQHLLDYQFLMTCLLLVNVLYKYYLLKGLKTIITLEGIELFGFSCNYNYNHNLNRTIKIALEFYCKIIHINNLRQFKMVFNS